MFPADFDRDGDPDVLAMIDSNHEVVWFENRLDFTGDFVQRPAVAPFVQLGVLVHAADFDGDGDPDILCASSHDDEVAWYANRLDEPSAGFGPKQVLASGFERPVSLDTPDLDGDGHPDVVIVSQQAHQILWRVNRLDEPSADFGPLQLIAGGSSPSDVSAADLDGDGDPDLLTSALGDRVAWHENLGTNPNDADSDDDGLGDGDEVNVHGTDPNVADSDGDGLGDREEVQVYGTNPNASDSDGDGLSDAEEIEVHHTNPNHPDSDGDGLTDAFELAHGFDPNAGGDGTADPDGDGLSNLGEQTHGTDPNDPDSDNDGALDAEEALVRGTDPNDPDSD